MRKLLWTMSKILYLENKTTADIPENNPSRFPSPLYLASYLGHTRVVRVLLQHEADSRVRREGKYEVCWVAAAKGHTDVVRALVEINPELLQIPAPETPLYAASFHGCWKTCRDSHQPESDSWCTVTASFLLHHRLATCARSRLSWRPKQIRT